jgi:phage terminase large subunit
MIEIMLPNNWLPRTDQRGLWDYLETGGRRAVCVAHRRWGKDDVALHYTATALHQRIGNYWHMLPKYEHARIAIWDAINPRTGKKRIDEAFPLELRKSTNSQKMMIEFLCGSTWQLVGSDNYNSFVGSQPVGVVFSEWALADPLAWGFIRPIIEENGGWVLFIYTSRGHNHGETIFNFAANEPKWFAQKITALDSPVFTPEQLDNIKREMIAEMGDPQAGEALFFQEYHCSFQGARLGAYYSRQMQAARDDGRICRVPYQPQAEVDTFWDLGMDDSMAIWFVQHIGQAHHVIDYYEQSYMGLEHYAKILQAKGYKYACHYMPHDAAVHEMSSGEIAKSRQEVAEGLGISPVVVVERPRNMDQIINVHIPAVRNLIPQCWFDAEKCAHGISALESYHAEYSEEKKVLSTKPEHNWSSHGADAFRTFAVGYAPKKKHEDLSVSEMMRKIREG